MYKEEHKHSFLLCDSCKARGLSKKDRFLYKCTNCKEEFGCKRFGGVMLANFKRDLQTKLECKICIERIATRLKQLETALKKSKRVCTCYQPLHAAKCPLSYCYFGENRWPGSDGQIVGSHCQNCGGMLMDVNVFRSNT